MLLLSEAVDFLLDTAFFDRVRDWGVGMVLSFFFISLLNWPLWTVAYPV